MEEKIDNSIMCEKSQDNVVAICNKWFKKKCKQAHVTLVANSFIFNGLLEIKIFSWLVKYLRLNRIHRWIGIIFFALKVFVLKEIFPKKI